MHPPVYMPHTTCTQDNFISKFSEANSNGATRIEIQSNNYADKSPSKSI